MNYLWNVKGKSPGQRRVGQRPTPVPKARPYCFRWREGGTHTETQTVDDIMAGDDVMAVLGVLSKKCELSVERKR